jgi:fumarate reductase (CoM/CoB) subunit B
MNDFTILVSRYDSDHEAVPHEARYELSHDGDLSVLDALRRIRQTYDGTLAFRESCGTGRCGSCAVEVDGKPALACQHLMSPGSHRISPLRTFPVIRDLTVDVGPYESRLKEVHPNLVAACANRESGQQAGAVLRDLALCTSCLVCEAGCPAHSVAPDRFEGPAIMTAIARWMADPRDTRDRVEDASKSGVDSCASCFRCSNTCSRGIDVFTSSVRFAREAELSQGYLGTATDRQMVATFREFWRLFPVKEPPLSVKYGSSQANGRTTTGVFLGCMLDVRHQALGERLLKVLEENGVPFVVPEQQVCCGGPLLWKGRVQEAKEAAHKNVEVFEAAGVQRVITACPGCKLAWSREYPRLLGGEALGSFQVVDICEVVGAAKNAGCLGSKTVGYFPPCHTQGHDGRDSEPPEILLHALHEAGSDYVQAVLGECCGGMAASSDPQVARKLGSRVIERAVNAGIEVLVTTCPFCVENLSRSARELKAPLNVMNIMEIV